MLKHLEATDDIFIGPDGDIQLEVVEPASDNVTCKIICGGVIKGGERVRAPGARHEKMSAINRDDEKILDQYMAAGKEVFDFVAGVLTSSMRAGSVMKCSF